MHICGGSGHRRVLAKELSVDGLPLEKGGLNVLPSSFRVPIGSIEADIFARPAMPPSRSAADSLHEKFPDNNPRQVPVGGNLSSGLVGVEIGAFPRSDVMT